jgi:TonB family protein
MKFIDGETLNRKLYHEKRISPASAIHIIRQLAEALDYAHGNGVVHRDIKPANVIMDPYGRAMLMDFGVARVQYEGNITKTGTVLGTPHYLPPEQPLGKTVDARSDIYSLGIMFYEMLSGELPFQDDNSIAILFKHINEQAAPLKSIVPDLHPDLYALVHKMIEKEPGKRPQDAHEVVEVLTNLGSVYPAPTPAPVRRSTPSAGHNTEQLLLLAREHVVQDKMDKALEIYTVVTQRDPKNPTAQAEISKILRLMIDRVQSYTTNHQYTEARTLLRMLDPLTHGNERVEGLKAMVELEERLWADKHATEIKDSHSAFMTSVGASVASEEPSTDPVAPITILAKEIEDGANGKSAEPLRPSESNLISQAIAAAPPVVPAVKKPGLKRIGILLAIGAVLIAATYFFTKPDAVGELADNSGIALLRRISERNKGDAKQSPGLGQISITTEPAGAAVFINNEARGNTPLELKDLPPGKYPLRVKLEGYQDYQQEVLIDEENLSLTVPVVLKQVVARPQGTVRLVSIPEGADVIVNGKTLGKTPLRWTRAPAGEHVVLFQKEGYQDRSLSVLVLDQKETSLETQLVELAQVTPQQPAKEETLKPGTLVEMGPDVVPPKSAKRDSAAILSEMRRLNRDGRVSLILLISETGNVIDAKVVNSTHPTLADAAVKLVKSWTYTPATKKGVPVKVWFPAAINFKRK